MPPVSKRGEPDSCVVMYWNEKELQPGQSREMAFAYGLGSVTSGEGGGRLGLTLSGSFAPGGTFTLTAYVNNPVPGETLTLTLPEGFRAVDNDTVKPVPQGTGRVPVSWKIKAGDKRGKFPLRGFEPGRRSRSRC